MVNFFIAFLGVYFSGQQASILFGFSSSKISSAPFLQMQILIQLVQGMTAATNAANYIFWLEQLQPTVRETEENKSIGPEDWKSLELDNLQFSYPLRSNARVLRGVNLQVYPQNSAYPL
jgi:ATP-binding cassette subfamily B (MDR/TAP) protein 1